MTPTTTTWPLRLVIDPPASGSRNMAMDEALLWAAADEQTVTLRFYQWSEPTLSLGYFQRYEDRRLHAASHDCAVVRRQSGGGAILHDQELTYSLTVPSGHVLAHHRESLYLAVHQAFIDVLRAQTVLLTDNWHIDLWNCRSDHRSGQQPFLCFQRRSHGDVVLHCVEGDRHHKIIGSAQRRRHGAILQHGSILLGRSIAAPELSGLDELVQLQRGRHELVTAMTAAIFGRFTTRCRPIEPVEITDSIEELAGRLAVEKYARTAWLTQR